MRDYASLPTHILAETAAAGLKVVFSGEGGDEAFAGYRRYRPGWAERWAKTLLHPGQRGLSHPRTMVEIAGRDGCSGPARRAPAGSDQAPFRDAWRETPEDWSDLQRRQYVDLVTALPDNLLVKTDRMLMAFGLEGRVPFLDHRLVEFGLSLPDRLKVRGREGKALLKDWARPRLPPGHLDRPKRGFHVPVGDWLRGEHGNAASARALTRNRGIQEWFRPEAIPDLVRARQASPSGWTGALRDDAVRHLAPALRRGTRHQACARGGSAGLDREPSVSTPPRIAVFLSTSGHSGVDRAARNLIPALARRGYPVDLLKVRATRPAPGRPAARGARDRPRLEIHLCLPARAGALSAPRAARGPAGRQGSGQSHRPARARPRRGSQPVWCCARARPSRWTSPTAARLERWLQRTSMGRLYPFADQVIVPSAGAADDMAAYTGLDARAHPRGAHPRRARVAVRRPLPRPDHPWLGDPEMPADPERRRAVRPQGVRHPDPGLRTGPRPAALPADDPRARRGPRAAARPGRGARGRGGCRTPRIRPRPLCLHGPCRPVRLQLPSGRGLASC